MSYIIIVTGERDWTDRDTIYRVLDQELYALLGLIDARAITNKNLPLCEVGEPKDFILRHGVARGADTIANDWGKEKGVTIERFPAEWHDITGQYHPEAGPIRNRQMAEAMPRANKCCAFWSGRTRKVGSRDDVSGTLGMMQLALQHHIPLRCEPPSPR